MGCDFSKHTKQEFSQRVEALNSLVRAVAEKRAELDKLVSVLNEPEEQLVDVKEIHRELTNRLEKLELQLEQIHLQNALPPEEMQDVYKEIDESSDGTFERDSSFDDERVEPPRPPVIIEDPSIKAMIEEKRRQLEKKSRKRQGRKS